MGLTIHYSARLKNINLLPALVHEVADICQSMGWEAQEINEIVTIKEEVVLKTYYENIYEKYVIRYAEYVNKVIKIVDGIKHIS